MQISPLFFALGLFLVSPAALAQQPDTFLRLAPVLTVSETDSGLEVQFTQSCNAKYEGLAIKSIGQGILRMAVVTRQESIVCAQVPALTSVKISGLRMSSFRAILPLETTAPNTRLTSTPAQDVAIIMDQQMLQTVHETRCGQQLGHILTATDDGAKVTVSVLEELAPNSGACDSKLSLTSLDHVILPSASIAAPKGTVDTKLVYELRLAPVQEGSVKRLRGGRGIGLAYTRRCDEAPVGIVVDYRKGETYATGHAAIGMMVARYPNKTCAADVAKHQIEKINDQHIELTKGAKISRMLAGDDHVIGAANLKVVPPQRYAYGNRATGEGLAIDFLAACAKPIGAVYARDRAGNLSVGVVTKNDVARCKNPIKEVSLLQPHFVRSSTDQAIYGLRVQGYSL